MSRTYTDDEKRAAIDAYVEHGPSEAGRQLGIPKQTINEWAKAEGRTYDSEKTQAATAASVAVRKSRLADRLLAEAEAAVELELEKLKDAELRDLVGARTRAIHDLQLLSGEATARTESVSPERAQQTLDELAERRKRSA